VKLLLDQNLSPRLARTLAAIYPETTHVRDVCLQAADDDTVWAYAAEHGFVIVSKDADFHQRSFSCSSLRRRSCGSAGDLLYGRDRGDPPTPRGRLARLRARFSRSPDGSRPPPPRRSREVDRLCSCRVTRPVFLEAFLQPSPGLWEVWASAF